LVVANKEENREIDVRRLREADVNVWVTHIETVPEAIASMRRLFEALGWGEPEWLTDVAERWASTVPTYAHVAVPIWRDPWMVVGQSTFTGDLLARLGCANVFGGSAQRYPKADPKDFDRDDVLVLLPDEPYVFSEEDGPEVFDRARTQLVSGRLITWYGPSLLEARDLTFGERRP
ncbi:MAG TPA: helical backbone metal receptor, partial [Nocardioidaceae bacterium]|nr:helical backbone metal receptor [Nocardioidaceae bacterium]